MKFKDGYIVEKFNYDKLEVGMEVFSLRRFISEKGRWETVYKINENKLNDFPINTNHKNFSYTKDGLFLEDDCFPSLVAMRRKARIEEIPTKEFEVEGENYNIYFSNKTNEWKVEERKFFPFYNCPYYTKENAELLCYLLNEKGVKQWK